MLDFPRWKAWLIWASIALGVIFALPSVVPSQYLGWLPKSYTQTRINLGLDLAGGSHLLLEADRDGFVRAHLETMQETVRTELGRGDPPIDIGDISTADNKISFFIRDSAQVDAARERISKVTTGVGLTGQRDWNVAVEDGNKMVLTPTKAGIDKALDDAMNVAREVVAKRIDEMGTKEPTIIRQGDDRILVQVPGLQDPTELKNLLGKTAKLEFKLVDLTATAEQIAAGQAPPGSQILPYSADAGARFKGAKIAVQRRVMLTGDQLLDAQQGYDPQTNEPDVSIRFDGAGGRRFAKVTQQNVGKPFAIIVDGQVVSAPNIREPILGGTAQISGSFTVQSANQLAIALRSGKLPIELKVVEERTVGPDLGADSIRKGAIAGVVATVAVILLMLITYLRFGVYTTIALVVNAFLILGVMAIFNATLTLPGIAGFVLTIGAAVDANVLINERIREEQRRGRNVRSAIEFGYKEASRAIFDANFTNVISAVIMFYFGTGPIRGFAVVLAIGIVTSVFTGVTFTRLLVADWVKRNRPKELVI